MTQPTPTEIKNALIGLRQSDIAPLGMNLDIIAALLSLQLQNSTGGTAGTPNNNVVTVQGITNGVALNINNALAPSAAISGTKTLAVANTFETVRTTTLLRSGIWIQAGNLNTGNLNVRVTGTTDGLVLEKKDVLFFAIDDPSKIEIAVSVAGDRVRWWGS